MIEAVSGVKGDKGSTIGVAVGAAAAAAYDFLGDEGLPVLLLPLFSLL